MKRERRSAKEVVHDYANELLNRTTDKDATTKLLAVETIAYRMGWTELYNQLRFRKRSAAPEQWWQK